MKGDHDPIVKICSLSESQITRLYHHPKQAKLSSVLPTHVTQACAFSDKSMDVYLSMIAIE